MKKLIVLALLGLVLAAGGATVLTVAAAVADCQNGNC